MERLEIAEGDVLSDGVRHELSASVDGERVYFRFFGEAPFEGPTGEPFLAAAMVAAMRNGRRVEVSKELPVSQRFLHGLDTYQEIFSQWFPDLHRVEVSAATTVDGFARTGATGLFFSGGVDGHYSLLRNLDRVTHLVLCLGLDIPPDERDRWQRTVASIEKVASAHGKRLCLVESDVKARLQSATHDNHGTILVSTALGLGFDTLLVPATHDYLTVHAYGTHPLTDAALSTGRTTVEHDGMAPRSLKLRRLIDAGVDLDDLRVCNRHTDFNCGTCEKCLRTMTALEILGQEVASLPRLKDPGVLRGIRLWGAGFADYWEDNLSLAHEYGRRDIAHEIEPLLRWYRRREAIRAVDSAWLGGRIARWRERARHRA
jgi:hypothetical protein